MWNTCLIISIGMPVLFGMMAMGMDRSRLNQKRKFNFFHMLFAGVFLASVVMFYPVNLSGEEITVGTAWRSILVSVFHSIQVFTAGCDFSVVTDGLIRVPDGTHLLYQIWAAVLYVLAPVFTFGFVLSLFKNLSASIKYLLSSFRDVYVFSELNERSFVLAEDIKTQNRKAVIVFTDVFEDNGESSFELMEAAKSLRAICFKKDVLVVNFKRHSKKRSISFFAIGANETENLNQALKLLERYKSRENTNLYVFSTKLESELLLSSTEKGAVRVRRVNEVQSLINRILYERGEIIFESARDNSEGEKDISAIMIGMGSHGTEMLKALSWFGQMDGYRLEINAFDRDPLAEEKFVAMAPELMSEKFNGTQYNICIHSDVDVYTDAFAKKIGEIKNATYVFVALGNDDVNIETAVKLRMYFERMKIHPVIQAVIYNSEQKRALRGIRNFSGQQYDIDFIGDIESSYVVDVIIDSELEEEALARHLKWGAEEDFWNYEYNYKSSIASAIHRRARIQCGIPGAEKRTEELTTEERDRLEILEHRRWNAYMRAEGYIYSGSREKTSRNDLAKMHHNLSDFSELSEEDKRKDSQVGTK